MTYDELNLIPYGDWMSISPMKVAKFSVTSITALLAYPRTAPPRAENKPVTLPSPATDRFPLTFASFIAQSTIGRLLFLE